MRWGSLNSQTLNFRNFTTREGLISDEVYDLFQDRQGYIWIFSKFGTLKFNGREFKPVLKNLPTNQAFIYAMCESADGRKWVSNSNACLFEVRNDSAIQLKGFEKESAQLKDKVAEIYQLVVDDSLNLFAITKGACYKLKIRGNSALPARVNPEGERDSVVVKVYRVGRQQVFGAIVTCKDYEFIDVPGRKYIQVDGVDEKLRLPTCERSLSYKDFEQIGDRIYFYYGNLICWIGKNSQVGYTRLNGLITSFCLDQRGHTWVATTDGLVELDESGSFVTCYLKNTFVPDVLVDRDGGLWATTDGHGLYYCRDLRSRGFTGSPLGGPLTFLKVQDGELFAGTISGDLYRASGDSMRHLSRLQAAMSRDIIKQGKYHLALYNQTIQILDLSSNPEVISTYTVGNRYNVLRKNEDTLIYSWSRGVAYAVKGREAKIIDYERRVFCVALVRDTLWMGTQSGVAIAQAVFFKESRCVGGTGMADKEQLVELPILRALRDVAITAIKPDPETGAIWFCSQGEGLYVLHKARLTHYTSANGLPSNVINSLSFAPGRILLMSTNRGLFVSQRPPDESGAISGWVQLTEGNAKEAVYFNGAIYVNGREGLTIISKADLRRSRSPSFFLRDVRVDSLTIAPSLFNQAEYGAGMSFRFDLVSFDTQRPTIHYSLNGELVDSGQANANMTIELKRLNPGNYTLTAYPDVAGGTKAPIFIPFVVKPAYWQTGWFYLACALLAALIIGVGGRWVFLYNSRKQAERARNEQLIEEYKMIALKAQVNPHFMSNCLAAIQSIILAGQMESAAFYVARFGLMVREILNLSSRSLVPLQQELNVLELYLEMEKLRFKFTYGISVDGGIRTDELYVPSLILNPIVENAIWHGLMALTDSREKRVDIVVGVEEERLAIRVIDNGAGRSGQKRPSVKGAKSYGLQITADRLSNLNYIYQTEDASMEIKDLTDQMDQPAGTEVIIYLPPGLSDETVWG